MAGFTAMAAGSPFVQAGSMNPSDPWGSYNSAYKAAASTNNNLYQQAMSGYAQMIAQANAAQQQVTAGYGTLQRKVVQGLKGSNRANLQDIADQFTSLSGSMSQQMIDRGLGNTTVQQSVQRGVSADYAKERTRSQGAFAQLIASMRSQLGQARLQSQQQGIGMMSGLQSDQLHYLASIASPYPDPGMYAQMAAGLASGGGGMGMGMPGPSPGLGPTGGYTPHYGGGYVNAGDVGGTYSPGFGSWATGGQPSFSDLGGGGGGGDPYSGYAAVGGGLGAALGGAVSQSAIDMSASNYLGGFGF